MIGFWKSVWTSLASIPKRFVGCFFEMEGDKKIVKKKSLKWLAVGLFLIVISYQFLSMEDTSRLERSYQPIVNGIKNLTNASDIEYEKKDEVNVGSVNNNNEKKSKKQNSKRDVNVPMQIVYSAKQVIDREMDKDLTMGSLPSGSNFIGKLLDSIDSRNGSSVTRVVLPYGAQNIKGGSIPKNSTLVGSITASGESEKIFIRFSKIIFPSGEAYKIDAQALTSNDYSPGIIGSVQSNADSRMFGSVAMTIVSTAADVFTQKTTMGGMPPGIGMMQTEPTAKNAALQGISQLAKEEAGRKAQKAQSAENYVVAPADSDLIVNLLSPFNFERTSE